MLFPQGPLRRYVLSGCTEPVFLTEHADIGPYTPKTRALHLNLVCACFNQRPVVNNFRWPEYTVMDFTSSPETVQLAQGLAQPTAADWDASCREPWIDFGEDHLRPRLDEILGYMDLVSSMDSEAAQPSGTSVRLVESIFPYSSITRIHLLVVLRGHEGDFRAAHSIARYG